MSTKRPRGRPRLGSEAQRFREEIARQLRAALTSRKLSVRAAAEALGISRQALYRNLAALATPHPETIARAMDLWHIEPDYKGEKIARGALSTVRNDAPPAPTQLSLTELFEVPQVCHSENLVVTVHGSNSSILHVTIRMKQAAVPGPVRASDSASKAS